MMFSGLHSVAFENNIYLWLITCNAQYFFQMRRNSDQRTSAHLLILCIDTFENRVL